MIGIIIGMISGTFIGVSIMCLFNMSASADRKKNDEERKADKYNGKYD